MLVLGLLLIVAAAVVAVGAIYDAGEEATVEILGQVITTTAAGVFVAGALTMLMFLVGVWALMSSMSRARRKRSERKEAKARQRESVAELEEERAALRAENERLSERLAGGTGATPATHETSATHDTPATHDTSSGTHEGRTLDRSATPGADTRRSDRVIDHTTDLRSEETTSSGRHRDSL